jgi:hypothetical protein
VRNAQRQAPLRQPERRRSIGTACLGSTTVRSHFCKLLRPLVFDLQSSTGGHYAGRRFAASGPSKSNRAKRHWMLVRHTTPEALPARRWPLGRVRRHVGYAPGDRHMAWFAVARSRWSWTRRSSGWDRHGRPRGRTRRRQRERLLKSAHPFAWPEGVWNGRCRRFVTD